MTCEPEGLDWTRAVPLNSEVIIRTERQTARSEGRLWSFYKELHAHSCRAGGPKSCPKNGRTGFSLLITALLQGAIKRYCKVRNEVFYAPLDVRNIFHVLTRVYKLFLADFHYCPVWLLCIYLLPQQLILNHIFVALASELSAFEFKQS